MIIKNIIKNNRYLMNIYESLFQRPIYNVLKANNTKRAAYVYSTYHFKKNNYASHTNYQESETIVKILDSLGYTVDVFNNNKEYNVDFSKYSLFFGEGILINKAIIERSKVEDYKVIYYGTGSHPNFNNIETVRSLKRYFDSFGDININYSRLVDQRWGIAATLADSAIIIGNDQTKNTFIDNGQLNCRTIKPTVFRTLDFNTISENRIIESAKKNILYFSSYGLVHKGLDLILQTAKSNQDITYHICGKIYEELSAESVLFKEMTSIDNVVVHGFVDVESVKFQNIITTCMFCILPSCAEGTSTAVITAMLNGGLIPILTKESGVDIRDNGIEIIHLDVESVNDAVEIASNLDDAKILNMSKKSYCYASEFNMENFSNSLKEILIDELSTTS